MSNACFNTNQFENVDGLDPLPWLQLRHVSTVSTSSRAEILNPSGGAIDKVVQALDIRWMNTSPIPQYAYTLLSRGASQVVTTSRTRAVLQVVGGDTVSVNPPLPGRTMPDSIHGGGIEGQTGVFVVWEDRQPAHTSLFGQTMLVNPGETYRLMYELRYVTEFTGTQVSAEAEQRYISGLSKLDIYAYPKL